MSDDFTATGTTVATVTTTTETTTETTTGETTTESNTIETTNETTTESSTEPTTESPTEPTTESPTEPTTTAVAPSVTRSDTSPPVSNAITLSVIQSLTTILPRVPPSLSTSSNPAFDLLHDSETAYHISSLLRHPNSGAGDNNLCRWLYDTFQSGDAGLKLVVLRFVPVVVGVYLTRVARRKSLAGFEAVLLALYAHETNRRASQPVTVNIPDLSHPSIYHESKSPVKNNATALNLAVISPSLEPQGTVRSTKRARIVGVALELYYTKIDKMPESSKIEFCEFCEIWAGQDGGIYRSDENQPNESNRVENQPNDESNRDENQPNESNRNSNENQPNESTSDDNKPNESSSYENKLNESSSEENNDADNRNGEEKEIGRIPLPWEILQPVLRVLGHCLLGANLISKCKKEATPLFNAASAASRSLYARSMHDINPKAILATGSLLRLGKMAMEPFDEIDYTEISMQNIINL